MMFSRIVNFVGAATLGLAALAAPSAAQEGAKPLTAADLETFLDGIIETQLQNHNVPGVSISVVKDGRVLLAKGYGKADVAEDKPVDPYRTLFRPGSIAKLFTWTAVMQLVEQGKLDLTADVNTYLTDFQIPDDGYGPITLRDILTHTPGLEDGGFGYLFTDDPANIMPLSESLPKHMPARVRAPFTHASYSNWATALAGHIVATVSGVPFNDYVQQNILDPLGMRYATFVEPLPERLAPYMSEGYRYQNGVYKPQKFEIIASFGPAGALSASADDMAKFMIAHLQNGEYQGRRILRADTAELMHSQLQTHDPWIPGSAHGFYETHVNGYRIIGHGGDTIYFHSDLWLLKDQNVGVYVSYNASNGRAREELLNAFMDRYFPGGGAQDLEPPADFAERAARYAGTYRINRHNYSTLEKALTGIAEIPITATEDNTLVMSTPFGDTQWVEVGPNHFLEIGGESKLAFGADENGDITYLYLGDITMMIGYKLAWYETLGTHMFVLGAGAFLFILTFIAAYNRRKTHPDETGSALWTSRSLLAMSGLNLAFLLLVVILFATADQQRIVFDGWPAGMGIALTLPIIAIVPTLASLYFSFVSWRDGVSTVSRRVFVTLVTLFGVFFLWSLNYWNALGWNY